MDTSSAIHETDDSTRVKIDNDFARKVLVAGAQHFKSKNVTDAVKALCNFALSELQPKVDNDAGQ